MSILNVSASSGLAVAASRASSLITGDLGRWQRGQRPFVGFDPGGVPDAPPILSVIDSSATTVATYVLPYVSPTLFGRLVFLGTQYALGTFLLRSTWTINGSSFQNEQAIEIVGGGDTGGGIISIYAFTRPGSNHVLAQLASGRLVQGSNPRL